MALFRRNREPVVPVATRLDSQWFSTWLGQILEGTSEPRTEEIVFEYLVKASMVIDHHCEDYVGRYVGEPVLSDYKRFYLEHEGNPWEIVAFVAGCSERDGWVEFIVKDVEGKLERFSQILIDPSVVD